MAPPRRKKKRERDYSAEYQRRQARARSLGYGSYYERRVAGVPRGARARARGHRGRADFLRDLGEGDLIIVPEGIGSVTINDRGLYTRMTKLVIDAVTGRARTYVFRNFSRAYLSALIDAEEARGAVWSPAPSLDQRRLATGTA